MYNFNFYIFDKLIWIFIILIVYGSIGQTTSHKIPSLFTQLPSTDTHQTNFSNYMENGGLVTEKQFEEPLPDFNNNTTYGDSNNQNNSENINNKNANLNQNINDNKQKEENTKENQQQEVTKQDLSNEAYKLQDEVQSIEESKDKMKELENMENEVSEQLKDTNYDKLNELIKKRNILVNKISATAKTLRKKHDDSYPELKEQPIVIIAKNKDDEKRKANQLAHLEGFEDFMNHITTPCNMMEELRQKSKESKKSNFKNKFETEQKILDSMSLNERLNYDRNMIEHYESIMQEIEQGIRNAEDEINKSWNHFEE